MSSSVASSGEGGGSPRMCWCGAKVVLMLSRTKENPFRRFFRGSMRSIFFKWVKDATWEGFAAVEVQIADIEQRLRGVSEQMEGVKENEKARRDKRFVMPNATVVAGAMVIVGGLCYLYGKWV
ncbi:hypothetical protein N665_1067s0002 [Sinapis alba]|nr:hypothetical protein N665_1067s0002 [Sinapis alba]